LSKQRHKLKEKMETFPSDAISMKDLSELQKIITRLDVLDETKQSVKKMLQTEVILQMDTDTMPIRRKSISVNRQKRVPSTRRVKSV